MSDLSFTEQQRGPTGVSLVACILLLFIAPPLSLFAWALLSGSAREYYLRSSWIRAGFVIVVVSALPLTAIIIATSLGLTRDPNPNPIGFGLLFFLGGVVGSICCLIGDVLTWKSLKQPDTN